MITLNGKLTNLLLKGCIAILCMVLWGSCTPENRVIEKPGFLLASSRTLEISKITLTDTATVLYFDAHGPAKNWFDVAKTCTLTDNKGNVYPVQSSEGIELGKKLFLSETGDAKFSLVFPPLKRGAKSVDFSEGPEVKGGYHIRGIRLTDEFPEGYFRYTLKGTIPTSAFDGQQLSIYCYTRKCYLGKMTVQGNQFEYHGIADSAMFCRVDVGQYFGNFIIEEGTVNVGMASSTNLYASPSGTPLNEAFAESLRMDEKIGITVDSMRQSIIQGKMDRETRIKRQNEFDANLQNIVSELEKEIIRPFILKHANDEAGAAVVRSYLSTPEVLDDIYPHLGPWILSRKAIQEEIARINQSRKMNPGQPFIDFEGKDINGNKVKLSDYVGKGKYVIVDFSASWCGPCKEEMPNLANVYNTYKNDKFDMVTVMVWDNPKASKKMLEEFKVNWKSIIDVGMKPMELYGFSGIPRIILFAPDGSVVHNNLRGSMIDEKVKEVLGK